MISEQLKEWILDEANDDIVGLWYVISWGKHVIQSEDIKKVRAIVLDTVRDLLQQDLLVAGMPTKDGKQFIEWNDDSDSIVRRIDNEWSNLGHEPGPADIVWFAKPSSH